MTQRISFEQEEKTGHAQVLVRCYGDSVTANSKLVESAMSSMEEPDMAAFVQVGSTCSSATSSGITSPHLLLLLPLEFRRAHHKVRTVSSCLPSLVGSFLLLPSFCPPCVLSIFRVKVASSSGPSEVLQPGYEKLSDYRFSFTEQENALKSIAFITGLTHLGPISQGVCKVLLTGVSGSLPQHEALQGTAVGKPSSGTDSLCGTDSLWA